MQDRSAQLDRSPRCHIDWGPEGVAEAVERREVVVVVDALRFSSTAAAAVHAGMRLLPVDTQAGAGACAAALGLPLVISSRNGDRPGQPTDSPLWYARHARSGSAAIYPSPNGARLAALATGHPHVLLGAFLNLSAVAALAARLAREHGLNVTVVAAGERSIDFAPHAPPRRLFAVEDYLAAGGIARASGLDMTADARVAAGAWVSCREDLPDILRSCTSGWFLIESGRADEVDYCARVDALPAVPVLRDDWVVASSESHR